MQFESLQLDDGQDTQQHSGSQELDDAPSPSIPNVPPQTLMSLTPAHTLVPVSDVHHTYFSLTPVSPYPLARSLWHMPNTLSSPEPGLVIPPNERHAGRNEPMFQERGPPISVRLNWPGYQPWRRQIPTRDFRAPPGPITRSKLAKNVAKSVACFIYEHKCRPKEEDGGPIWAVGAHKIDMNDLVLVRLDHVSNGSWQAQLQFIRPLNHS